MSVHLADALVAVIRYVHVSGSVERYPGGGVESGAGSRSAVSGKRAKARGGAIARHGRYLSGIIHLAYPAIKGIRDVDIPDAVHRQACVGPHETECGAGGRPPIAGVADITGAGNRTDNALGMKNHPGGKKNGGQLTTIAHLLSCPKKTAPSGRGSEAHFFRSLLKRK